ncbi:hypothetical protein GOP47_0026825 [Adiantum capillus-veneris]|nr:hypothetical protein GOP47_0026825 [Adiantum capillus-veneris]
MQLINASTQELRDMVAHALQQQNTSADLWATWMQKNSHDPALDELAEAARLRPLPLGFHPGQKSDMMVSSIGHACALQEEDLKKFMNYTVRGECPDDQDLVQRLLLDGCEPLPRRRCFAVTPKNFTKPYPIPESYWTLPPDDNILWSGYIDARALSA